MGLPAEQIDQAVENKPTSDMSAETIRRRASGGLLSLAARRVIHQMISFGGNIALARMLSPSVFGIFATVTYVVNFFGFFGDIGFGAALVQRKEQPTEKVLRTIFTIQQTLITILVLLVFAVAPFIAKKYNLSSSDTWLFRALSLSLFLTSLKLIPAVQLERKLDFRRLVIPEIAEVFVFQCIAVTMAYLHYGVWSLVCATLARGLVGFTILFILSPWKIGFAFDKTSARTLLGFGATVQLGQFFWLLRNAATPLFAGGLCGMQAVGYLNWAWGLSLLPYAVIEIVNRIVFPVCSRLQHDPHALALSIAKYVRMAALGVFPVACVVMAVAPWAVEFVYTPKWTPAIPSLYFFMLATMSSPIINIYSRAFYAMGMAKTAVKLTAVYVVTGWILNVPLVLIYGYIGIAISSFLVGVLCIWLPIRQMNKAVRIPVMRNVWAPLLSSAVSFALTRWIADMVISGVVTLVAVTLIGFVIYACCLGLLQGRALVAEVRSFASALKGPQESVSGGAEMA